MKTNLSIKQRLLRGDSLNGCWIEMFNPIACEIVAMSGYDTVLIDLEHGAGSFLDAISMMHAANQFDCKPLIRASSADIVDIKRVLDIGPAGIMIPNITGLQHAHEVVASCRYGPAGVRGAAAPIIRATRYGKDLDSYENFMANDFLLMAQIESVSALEEIEEIAKVDGIDMLFIGPADLSATLGEMGNFTSSAFCNAFAKIEETALSSGKLLGTIPFPGWDARRLYQNGHSLVISGADTLMLKKAAEEDVAMMKDAAK